MNSEKEVSSQALSGLWGSRWGAIRLASHTEVTPDPDLNEASCTFKSHLPMVPAWHCSIIWHLPVYTEEAAQQELWFFLLGLSV